MLTCPTCHGPVAYVPETIGDRIAQRPVCANGCRLTTPALDDALDELEARRAVHMALKILTGSDKPRLSGRA